MPISLPLVRAHDTIPPPRAGLALLALWAVALLLFSAITTFAPNRTDVDPFITEIY